MNVGDLVKLNHPPHFVGLIGVIIDSLEADDGWCHYEIVYTTHEGGQSCEWFSDMHVEVINQESAVSKLEENKALKTCKKKDNIDNENSRR
jgi:hypothetical protein